MKDLTKLFDDEEQRVHVIADCVALVNAEVKSKSGLSGIAVKTAFGLVKAIKPNMIENAVNGLLDEWGEELQKYYVRFQEEGENGNLERYLGARAGDVAEKLLSVTDKRASTADSKTAAKAYKKLRPKGKLHVETAVPKLGKLLDKYTAQL